MFVIIIKLHLKNLLQPTVQNVTNAEKLLNNIEKFSDSIASVFSEKLISSKKFEMRRDNFGKIMKSKYRIRQNFRGGKLSQLE